MEQARKKQFIAPQHELFTCSAPTRPFLLNFDIVKKTLNLIHCQFLPPFSTLSCQITPKMAQRVSQSTSSLQTEECEARSPGGCRGLVWVNLHCLSLGGCRWREGGATNSCLWCVCGTWSPMALCRDLSRSFVQKVGSGGSNVAGKSMIPNDKHNEWRRGEHTDEW